MHLLFWLSFAATLYTYFGYPLFLFVWGRIAPRHPALHEGVWPGVSLILPVHNEGSILPSKLENTLQLEYPGEMEILVVSDGSTDNSVETAQHFAARAPQISVMELPERGGKGNALNAGVAAARNPIVVFTDVGIMLERGSITAIAAPFADPEVGCVSGEDQIPELGGEGLYGKYELFLRRHESLVHSIVGASGSFYAQRRSLCPHFPAHIAPDFLSVLHTVAQRYRAISETRARGTMHATGDAGAEFRRKVRTLVRGMSGLTSYARLLNPFRFGAFAFLLFSHKLMRWLVPVFLVAMLGANLALLGEPLYGLIALPHVAFYALGAAHLLGAPFVPKSLPIRVAGYFLNVNAAIAVAWLKYLRGTRATVWTPTAR